ncbi:MAG: ABC transporter ATP-binding protein [Candidatus Hodarchaeales archaeon]|jgi:putative ABC transport system ATP-binding protein
MALTEDVSISKTKEDIIEEQVVLKTENLIKTYKTGDIEVHALRGVNFSVTRGEMISIMGASGSGKTTLLNMLGGLDSPTEGLVYLDGTDIGTMSDKQLTQVRRHKIGFIFQSYNLLPVLTAFENVELPMLIAGMGASERRARAEELLEIVGLKDRKHHKPDELSGGQKQRVAVARSLANRPAILLCDEPTGDLDTETGNQVMNLLEELNESENQTILVVTHDPAVGKRAQLTYHIKDGNIDRIEHHK